LEELSRAEAGQISLDIYAVDVVDLIRDAADRLYSQFEDKAVSLALELPTTPLAVNADSSRITQVLLNLLGNALHFTPAGGRVMVSARSEEREALVTVEDTGVGISDEHIPHIFERFYRVDKSRSRTGGGSGIGLTITKHLVQAHGGHIWASSPGLGRGSTFSFTLPLAP
jgi:signal transduction histidine kinase